MSNKESVREGLFLTVKPKPKPNESLSSFIVRVATENGISMHTIRSYIAAKQFHQVDIVYEHIDLEKLSSELEIKVSELNNYTFAPLLNYFNQNGVVDLPQYRMSLGKEISINKRRYCSSCLASDGIYKLLWQVSSISCCDEHHTILQHTCNSCGKSLPYVFETMALHLCVHCGESLKIDQYISERNEFVLGEQQRTYDNWNYLLKEYAGQNKPNLTSVQIACLILYLSSEHSYKTTFQPRKVRYFAFAKIQSLAAYVRDNHYVVAKKPNLQDIFTLSRNEEMSVEELFKITVPDTFINSFFYTKNEPQIGVCLAPWCKFYNTVDGMRETNLTNENKKRIYRHRESFRKVHACIGCYMRYGENMKGIWKDIDNRRQVIWSKIDPLVSHGYTPGAIGKMLNIHVDKVNEYFGYMLHFNTFSEKLNNKYLPQSIPGNLVQKLIDINFFNFSAFPNYSILNKEAKAKYGWSKIEFYFYAFGKEVQEYQLFEHYDLMTNKPRSELIKQKIDKTIKELYEKKVLLSIGKVAEEVSCSYSAVVYNGFAKLIGQYRKIQLQEKKRGEEEELSRIYEAYKKEIEQEQGNLIIKNIFNHLNRHSLYIPTNFPELFKKIVSDVKESKNKSLQLYADEMIIKTKNAIKLLTDTAGPITIIAVLNLIGLNRSNSKKFQYLLGLVWKEIQMAKELL